jgi:uncharacterized cupin superfamily protein
MTRIRLGSRIARSAALALACTFALMGFSERTSRAKSPDEDIVPVDRAAAPAEPGKYPSEMVVKDQSPFDGSYTSKGEYRSADRKFTVALWQSGPGVLKTDGYPHDEYCLVLEGHLVITNRSGTRAEFGPGDTFVIPKGWAGTWNMTTRFKKQYVAFAEREAKAR